MVNRIYSLLIPLALQTSLVYALNSFNTIQSCSLFFSLFTFHLLSFSDKNGLKPAFFLHSLSVVLNLLWNFNETYYIHGKPITGLFVASYLSLFLSLSAGLYSFEFRKRRNDYLGYGLSAFLTSVLDGLFMIVFFIPIYSMNRVLEIFFKEVGWKTFYTTLLLLTFYWIRKKLSKGEEIQFQEMKKRKASKTSSI